MRTLIDIPDSLVNEMTLIAELQHVSRAEAIRQAISAYVEQNRPLTADVFGIWKARGIDGLQYQEKVRSEW